MSPSTKPLTDADIQRLEASGAATLTDADIQRLDAASAMPTPGGAPPPPAAPLPAGLGGKQPAVDPNASLLSNYWHGNLNLGQYGPIGNLLDQPRQGLHTVLHGVEQLAGVPRAQPQDRNKEITQAEHKLFSGSMQAASPLVIAPLVANPVATGVGLGVSALGGAAGRGFAKMFGAPPEVQDVAGDVGSMAPLPGMPAIESRLGNKLRKSAAKNYVRILRPAAEADVPLAEQTADLMTNAQPGSKMPFIGTRKGLQAKMKARMDVTGPSAETAFAGRPPVDPTKIYQGLEGLRQEHAVMQGPQGEVVTNPDLNSALLDMRNDLGQLEDANGKIDPAALDDYTDRLFKGTIGATGKMRPVASESPTKLERSVAGVIRGVLDSNYPDAADINEAYKIPARVHTFLESARRKSVAAQSHVASATGLKAVGEAAATMAKPAFKALTLPLAVAKGFENVPWNLASAKVKIMLADQLARGDWANAMRTMKGLGGKPPAAAPTPLQLPAPPIITPQPETSFVRGVQFPWQDISTRPRLPAGPEPKITPPPAPGTPPPGDTSFVQGPGGTWQDISTRSRLPEPPPVHITPPPAPGTPPPGDTSVVRGTEATMPDIEQRSQIQRWDPNEKRWVIIPRTPPPFRKGGVLDDLERRAYSRPLTIRAISQAGRDRR